MATASKTPEKPPEEPLVKIAEPKAAAQLNNAGTSEFQPTADDMARLQKNGGPNINPPVEPDISAPATLVAPSRAKQTMLEMELGRKIVERKTEERRRRMEAQGAL